MSNFQAKAWSWSSRNRGYVNRTQKMRNETSMTLANMHGGPEHVEDVVGRARSRGPHQPPRNSTEAIAGEGEGGGELGHEEEQEAEAGVLDLVAADDLGLGHRHVERGLGQLGLHGGQEDEEARRTG